MGAAVALASSVIAAATAIVSTAIETVVTTTTAVVTAAVTTAQTVIDTVVLPSVPIIILGIVAVNFIKGFSKIRFSVNVDPIAPDEKGVVTGYALQGAQARYDMYMAKGMFYQERYGYIDDLKPLW